MVNMNATFSKVAEALLMDYSNIYYVNIRTDEYQWYSFNPKDHSLQLDGESTDFFNSMARDARGTIYDEDEHIFTEDLTKERLLEELTNGSMYSFRYRLMIDGKPVWHSLRLIQEAVDDGEYLILGVVNIDKEVRAQQKTELLERERAVFNQIAESLAGRYDIIYYIDIETGVYTPFNSGDIYGDVVIREEGNDFFVEAVRNTVQIVHPEDRDRIIGVLNKDYLITKMGERKEFTTDYRLLIDGEPQHTRLCVMLSGDKRHFIIGVENIEEEMRREQQYTRNLKLANEMARRDELTGVKNKNAFNEFIESIQRSINKGTKLPYAFVVCDLNDLKNINDTMGHARGDDYLVHSCRMICKIFSHSPVFRIGGDEFVVVLMHRDFNVRDVLFDRFRQQVREHQKNQSGPIIASGMAAYDTRHPEETVNEILDRADKEMYEEKKRLKSGPVIEEDTSESTKRIIPEGRRQKLDQLFNAFSNVAPGGNIFVCDMKYDYSRWAAPMVDYFGMPDEYMYDAGYLWEEHLHPDDRKGFHEALDEIFYGTSLKHDMQYRSRNKQGEFIPCTCRASVLRNRNGDADYFCGSIQNHGIQQSVDSITGLRNQYGFLEDLQMYLDEKVEMQIWMVGISRFSELNDIYGYHFGNTLLRQFGRYLFDHVAGKGKVYRLDGTKFAVLSSVYSEEVIRGRYEDLRAKFRDGFYVDENYIILELNSGLLSVNDFDIDNRTVYSCLNYAYSVSKNQKHGDLVRFRNALSSENEERIQKIQAIRASITRNFKGYFLTYQPVVDADTGRVIGAEALLRWKNDKYGLVPPDDFIEVMERDSLFPELGRWIMKTALKDAKKILKSHPDFIIDINLSYTQMERPGFVDEVVSILDELDFPPQQLCLEITERCRLLDIELLNNVVVSLRAKGVQISLDDFGTGFSSIGIVMDLPIDVIKLDRSFVKDIEDDERARSMIGAFTQAASLYGARVCAEGVETATMCEILRQYPVNSFQGYYYSRPLRLREFREWVSRYESTLQGQSDDQE